MVHAKKDAHAGVNERCAILAWDGRFVKTLTRFFKGSIKLECKKKAGFLLSA